jgi:hypothetical protein
MCQLLRRYSLQPAQNFKPQIRSGISLTTANGIMVELHRRALASSE